MIVKDIDGDTVTGEVQIDWGIGPEGRAPRPDERLHTKPWSAPWDTSGHLVFEVKVGDMDPATHVFDLWICPGAGDKRCGALDGPGLVGEVRIASIKTSPGIWSVTALPKR